MERAVRAGHCVAASVLHATSDWETYPTADEVLGGALRSRAPRPSPRPGRRRRLPDRSRADGALDEPLRAPATRRQRGARLEAHPARAREADGERLSGSDARVEPPANAATSRLHHVEKRLVPEPRPAAGPEPSTAPRARRERRAARLASTAARGAAGARFPRAARSSRRPKPNASAAARRTSRRARGRRRQGRDERAHAEHHRRAVVAVAGDRVEAVEPRLLPPRPRRGTRAKKRRRASGSITPRGPIRVARAGLEDREERGVVEAPAPGRRAGRRRPAGRAP